MRVAMIVNSFPVISQKFILNQAAGLIEAGVDLEVVAAMKPEDAKSHEIASRHGLPARTVYAGVPRSLGSRLIEFPALMAGALVRDPRAAFCALRAGAYTTAARSLKTLYFLRAFAGRSFDVIHCHFGSNGLIGAFLKDMGVAARLVVTFHGSDITTYPRRYGVRVYDGLWERADAVTAGTSFVKARIEAAGCPTGKILVLPAGIRMAEHPEIPIASRSPLRLLTVGRLVEVKGFRYALEAFAEVRRRYHDAEYLIAGDGPELPALELMAQEMGVAGAVRFLGEQSDVEVAALYREAAVFVLASIRASDGAEEGQGLVLQEAQAAGLPVVSTLVGGIPDGVIEGETGFLVPQRDSAALAQRIGQLLADASLRERMGKAGRAFAASVYDTRVLTPRLIALYKRIGEPAMSA
jgi:colanic acid/amylovoran biosynthesis glycosyltransferase